MEEKRQIVVEFAKTILKAMEIRENSYDHKLSDEMERTLKYPDFEKCYRLTHAQAAAEAVKQSNLDKEFELPVYLLLYMAWNDIMYWANTLVNP